MKLSDVGKLSLDKGSRIVHPGFSYIYLNAWMDNENLRFTIIRYENLYNIWEYSFLKKVILIIIPQYIKKSYFI